MTVGSNSEDGTMCRATIRYYHTGQGGEPNEMTDFEGHVYWHASNRLPGDLRHDVPGAAGRQRWPVASAHQPLRLMGHYLDPETGLHSAQHRHYDPDSGRFATQESMGVSGLTNPYQLHGRKP
jgi:RHS repeat-associated protein